MKWMAIENEVEGACWEHTDAVLKEEAFQIFQLYLTTRLREIYFNEHHQAVLILETPDRQTTLNILNELPLVKQGLITFNLMELRPYNGYEQLMMS